MPRWKCRHCQLPAGLPVRVLYPSDDEPVTGLFDLETDPVPGRQSREHELAVLLGVGNVGISNSQQDYQFVFSILVTTNPSPACSTLKRILSPGVNPVSMVGSATLKIMVMDSMYRRQIGLCSIVILPASASIRKENT